MGLSQGITVLNH